MKNFQQNLLITLALGLCVLCAWQWFEQTRQRGVIQDQNRLLYDRDAAIQGYTYSIASLNFQIGQMDARISQIQAAAAENSRLVVSQKAEIARLKLDNANFTNEISQYKEALDTLDSRLKDAYAGIEKQNQTITNLLAQRDDMVAKYNDAVKDRNAVVGKYNALVQQMQTNHP